MAEAFLEKLRFISLPGLTEYEAARELQLMLVEERAAELIPDTILFLEHPPIITQGRGLQYSGEAGPRHMPVPVNLPPGVAFAEAERGGDLTVHGPGQLVIYPICKLDEKGWGLSRDVVGFIRRLEGVLIEELAEWGLQGESRAHATGVWVEGRKVASVGIAVRKWVIYHGMAINCVNDMGLFRLISPCGFSPEVMAKLTDWTLPPWFSAREVGTEWAQVRALLETRLAERLARLPRRLNSSSP